MVALLMLFACDGPEHEPGSLPEVEWSQPEGTSFELTAGMGIEITGQLVGAGWSVSDPHALDSDVCEGETGFLEPTPDLGAYLGEVDLHDLRLVDDTMLCVRAVVDALGDATGVDAMIREVDDCGLPVEIEADGGEPGFAMVAGDHYGQWRDAGDYLVHVGVFAPNGPELLPEYTVQIAAFEQAVNCNFVFDEVP